MTLKQLKDRYPLTSEEKRRQTAERRFQKVVNSETYLTWDQVLRKVSPSNTYAAHDGHTKQIMKGQELLDSCYRRVRNHSCTFLTSIDEVPTGTQQTIQDLWETYLDPNNGQTMVSNHQQDLWDLDFFTEEYPTPTLPLSDFLLQELTSQVIETRQQQRNCENETAINQARPTTAAALLNSYNRDMLNGATRDGALQFAMIKATEAFDRAYGLARIRLAGIDIDQHPQLRSYQTYFDLGMAPPTHEEIADYIINTLASH